MSDAVIGRAYSEQEVRDGRHLLRFIGMPLGSGSTARSASPRWTEMAVYRLLDGSYILTRNGISSVVHRADCPRVGLRMMRLVDVRPSDLRLQRTACVECRPDLRHPDPDYRAEVDRYRAVLLADAVELVEYLREGREGPALPRIIRDLLKQCESLDDDVAKALHSLDR